MSRWAQAARLLRRSLGWFSNSADHVADLRSELSARFQGKRCLVLGSAPGARAPDPSRFDACICVNGSPWTAKQLGIDLPDLTVVVGHKTQERDNDVRLATLEVWRGLHTRQLLFVEIGDTPRHARSVFAKANFRYDRFSSVSPEERGQIIEAVCGKEMATRGSRISNGTFAAALVMWAGASEVIFGGFSMEGGHSYMNYSTRRGHQVGDAMFFQWVKDVTSSRITTTSEELNKSFGLPLIEGLSPAHQAGGDSGR